MLSKRSRMYSFLKIALFLILPILISIFMFWRVHVNIISLMEKETENTVAYQSGLISKQINEEFKHMQIMSEYFRDSRIPEEDMEEAFSYLLTPEQLSQSGILRSNETAVCGRHLPTVDYIAVRKAFRGVNSVMYSKDEGLLFAVPVYNNKNIKYVMYMFFDTDELFGSTVINTYNNRAQYALADSEQHTVAALSGSSDIGFYYNGDYQKIFTGLDNKLRARTTAASYNVVNGEKDLCFVSLISGCRNLCLIGKLPYDAVAADAKKLYYMVIFVSIFLLAMLSIGTLNIVLAGRKLRESDELREAKAAAESANKAKGEFIANMSHELRTPINVILGMNEMILREEADEETKSRAMDIKGAAQILLSLINDILDYTKIESGKMNIISAEYSLVTLIKDLSLLTENRATQKSMDFVLDIDPDLPVGLYGDDIRLRQILTNLLTNAVKYTNEGKVTLRMTGTPSGDDSIKLRCEVIDTGIGIKKEDIDKLLVPYMRIEEKRNRNVEGTGLGMPIIVNLLMLMGSMLNVDSVYGEGSTFWFELDQKIIDSEPVGDIRKRMGDMVKEYNYRVSFVAPKARVLVVDDNSMNRQIFVSLLSKTQIQIDTAPSGMKCLELVQQVHYDMIFMDYLMPEMNGIETLHALKELEGNLCKDSPVIALTANAFSGDREKYMSYGFDDFLAKPIVTEKLEAMIMEMLPQEYISTTTEEIKDTKDTKKNSIVLPEVEGVNLGIARMYLKDDELVLNTLRDYYERVETDLRELPELYAKTDTDDGLTSYRIRVHALKSSSGVVGVMTASELSRVLEYASRDGDRERIRAVHPILMEELERMYGRLEPYKPVKAAKKQAQKAAQDTAQSGDADITEADEKKAAENLDGLSEQLQELRKCMDEMDFDGLERITGQINEYSYDDDIQDIIDKLCDDISFADFDSANEKIDKLLSLIENK